MKTYSAKPKDIIRSWYIVDASDLNLGRLSSEIAKLLIGKNKPQFTKHIDCGDFVIVVNASNLKVSGNKADKKMYYHHSGYPGGLKKAKLNDVLDKDPTNILNQSIKGMLPVNKLRDERMKRLKIYSGNEHNHQAQKPISVSLKGVN